MALREVPQVAFANVGGSGSWGYRFPEGVFGSKVAEEYALVRETFDLSDPELAEIARTSALVSGASRRVITRICDGVDAWLAGDGHVPSGSPAAD